MIRKATDSDSHVLAEMAVQMWDSHSVSEFASDCELDNITSFKFHMAMGFDEANRIICFKKKL